ncbi:MAG: hypothetical protein ACKO3S_12775 [bacterium]
MPLPTNDAALAAWLRFEDRLAFAPDRTTSLVIRARGSEDSGEDHPTPGWLREEFMMNCALVDPEVITDEVMDRFDYRSLSHPSWEDAESFDFGVNLFQGQVVLEPFVIEFPPKGSHKPSSDLRQEFTLYHQLRKTPEGNYRHPLDGLIVAEIKPYEEGYPDVPAQITVNLDYLRDFLAARGSALLCNLAMDRYASREGNVFGVEPHPQIRLRPGILREVVLDERNEHWGHAWVARATLFLTFVISPYDSPKEQRNPWSISYLDRADSTVPFIVDAAGTRRPMNEMNPRPQVLYFRRKILEHYLTTPAHNAFFITRRWGRATNARQQGVDVGLNSQGLITALTKDIADLPVEEQALWSAHSVSVNGEVCEDWARTRLMNDPPPTPNVVELIDEKRRELDAVLREIAGETGFSDARPSEQKLGAITIGPLTDEPAAFSDLALTLCQLSVDPLKDDVVRASFPTGRAPTGNARSLALLEQLLEARCGMTTAEAKRIVQPLRTLNWLRQESAHVGVEAFGPALAEIGFAVRPDHLWEAWDVLVDRIAGALAEVAASLRSTASPPAA